MDVCIELTNQRLARLRYISYTRRLNNLPTLIRYNFSSKGKLVEGMVGIAPTVGTFDRTRRMNFSLSYFYSFL